MPDPRDAMRTQSIQQMQSGSFPMDFDPDAVLQEIAQKDLQNQMKEQELAQREAALNQQAPQGAPPPPPEQMPPEQAPQGPVTPQQVFAPEEQQVDQSSDEKLQMALQLLNEAIEQRQAEQSPETEVQAAAKEPAPIVPMGSKRSPAPPGSAIPQGGQEPASNIIGNAQQGQEITVTKNLVMTPQGAVEIGHAEKLKMPSQQKQQGGQR